MVGGARNPPSRAGRLTARVSRSSWRIAGQRARRRHHESDATAGVLSSRRLRSPKFGSRAGLRSPDLPCKSQPGLARLVDGGGACQQYGRPDRGLPCPSRRRTAIPRGDPAPVGESSYRHDDPGAKERSRQDYASSPSEQAPSPNLCAEPRTRGIRRRGISRPRHDRRRTPRRRQARHSSGHGGLRPPVSGTGITGPTGRVFPPRGSGPSSTAPPHRCLLTSPAFAAVRDRGAGVRACP